MDSTSDLRRVFSANDASFGLREDTTVQQHQSIATSTAKVSGLLKQSILNSAPQAVPSTKMTKSG